MTYTVTQGLLRDVSLCIDRLSYRFHSLGNASYLGDLSSNPQGM
jgi:hypothetical protein